MPILLIQKEYGHPRDALVSSVRSSGLFFSCKTRDWPPRRRCPPWRPSPSQVAASWLSRRSVCPHARGVWRAVDTRDWVLLSPSSLCRSLVDAQCDVSLRCIVLRIVRTDTMAGSIDSLMPCAWNDCLGFGSSKDEGTVAGLGCENARLFYVS